MPNPRALRDQHLTPVVFRAIMGLLLGILLARPVKTKRMSGPIPGFLDRTMNTRA